VLGSAKEDTSKVKILNALAREFRNYQPDTAIYFAGMAKEIATRINDQTGLAGACLMTGIASMNLGNYEKAMASCKDALKIYDQLLVEDKPGVKIKILSDKAMALKTIGVVYAEEGIYPEALKNSLAALKISAEIHDKKGIARSSGNIGLVYFKLGNDSDALKNYFKALTINEEIGDKKGIVLMYSNIAGVYQHQGNFGAALKTSFDALKMSEEIGDKYTSGLNYGNIGLIYYNLENYTEALKNQFAALKIREEIGDKQGIALSYSNIGNVYAKQKKTGLAYQSLNKGLSLAKEIGNLEVINTCYMKLAEMDSAREDFKSSLAHYKMYIITRDSAFNRENTRKIMQSKMQYDFDQKASIVKAEQEQKDALAAKELQRQKLLKDFFISGILLILILSFFVYRTYTARQALRLNEIRNKIAGDLHDDIGSTLNSISIYSEVARKNDENHDEALEMIGNASREVIDAMSDIVWTINAENDSFEKIIFRMKSLAFNLFRAKNIEFTFHADEILNEKKLTLEQRRNFYLLFKEAVNNLVKYAHAKRASITLTYENNRIRLSVKDDGDGFDMSQENTGNGLKNMKRRADEMNAAFKIDSLPGSGTHLELILKV
jgi:signal transduction histidine kinase